MGTIPETIVPDPRRAATGRSTSPLSMFLWLNGRDLRGSPLLERKRLLRRIVPRSATPVLYVDHVVESGVDLFQAVCDQDLEGVLAKRADGLYTPDATTWVKIKNTTYSQAEGRRELFEARRAAGAT